MARDQLAGYTIAAHPEGLHIWLTLPSHLNRLDFTSLIRRQGLALVPSDAFLVAAGAPNAIRICIGAADSRADLYDAIRLIADAFEAGDPRRRKT
jgi:DNA-binding transcriptional MocR family regulator